MLICGDKIRALKNSLNLFKKYLLADCNKGQIFAGAGDTNICGGAIRFYLGNILVKHLSRYPEFSESQDGLQMSHTPIFIKSMAGSSEYSENPNTKVQLKVPDSMKGAFGSSSFNYAKPGISRIYKLIRGYRVSRNKSMSSVVHKFDTPMWNHAAIPFLIKDFIFEIEVLTTDVRYYYIGKTTIQEDLNGNGQDMEGGEGVWASLVRDALYNKELRGDDDTLNNHDVSGSKWSNLRKPATMLVGPSLFRLVLLISNGNSLLSTSCSDRIRDLKISLNLFIKYLHADCNKGQIFAGNSLPPLSMNLHVPVYMDVDHMNADVHVPVYIFFSNSYVVRSVSFFIVLFHAGHIVPVAAGAGDTNIRGGVIRLYWGNILRRCLDVNEQVRQSALKYPAFFESRDGLQMSYIFIRSMAGSSEYSDNPNSKVQLRVPDSMKGMFGSSSFNYARLGVSRIYKLIGGNRVSRNKFMLSVVHKFDAPIWNHAVIPFLM
ncbi:hypothetical protein RHMOL_Rhmol10G0298400 [Rhododendron molle]|uniref:Uncharacterized protein n=1 Tax=Rhododendron molle TaxID=49168 RepID=A0ACC0M7U9_RHOML|nr:hypothetical protein RHMOL_Rhmol10G0298400 [Rhododendron molle]